MQGQTKKWQCFPAPLMNKFPLSKQHGLVPMLHRAKEGGGIKQICDCDCLKNVIHQRSKWHAEMLKLDRKKKEKSFGVTSFLFRRSPWKNLYMIPKKKEVSMRVKKTKKTTKTTEGQVEQSWLNRFNSHANVSGFLIYGPKNGGKKRFLKNTFIIVTIIFVEISALCLVCVASWCWGEK